MDTFQENMAADDDIRNWLHAVRRNLRYALDGKLDLPSTAAVAIKLVDRALLALPAGDNGET